MSIHIIRATREILQNNMDKLLKIDVSVIGEQWTATNFLLDLPGKWEYSTLAFSEDELIGFAIFSYKDPVGHFHRLAVDDAFRRHGIASLMVKAALNLMKLNNIQILTGKIYKTNAVSRAFCKSIGFIETGESGDNILFQAEIASLSL
jgi:RimJ/RimL family protein N-acetyltransferase